MARQAISNRAAVNFRQNLLTNSETLDNAAWTKQSCTVTANQAANPRDGSLTMDLVTETGGVDFHRIYQATSALGRYKPGDFYSFSGNFKMNTCRYASFYLDEGSGSDSVIFDLQNGTISSTQTNTANTTSCSGTIRNLGNGIYRCTMTILMFGEIAAPFLSVCLSADGTNLVYASSGASLYMEDLRMVKANWEGFYTPTTSSTVTTAIRNAVTNRASISNRQSV